MTTADPQASPAALVQGLQSLLRLERIETDIFRGRNSDEPWPRVFGGQVVGQALVAASRTVDEARPPHSLHAYFMRPGDPAIPIVYQVHRDRDGGAFSSRRVVAIQHGQPILNLAASFHREEEGLRHQIKAPEADDPDAPEAPAPDPAPEATRAALRLNRPFEFRPARARFGPAVEGLAQQAFWFRTVAPAPCDQLMQRAMLAYASDMRLLSTALLPHGVTWSDSGLRLASLDHALWFHRDVDVNNWLLYQQESPWSGSARGMNRGLIFDRQGRLAASVAQEGFMRRAPQGATAKE